MVNAGWDLDPELILGRSLEEVRATAEGALLFRFSGHTTIIPVGFTPATYPPLYLGFRTAIKMQGDMGTPSTAVCTFPDGITRELLLRTKLLLPADDAPQELMGVMGLTVTAVYTNSQAGLQIPPSVMGKGFFIQFGDWWLEVNPMGLFCFKPTDRAGMVIQ